MAIRSYWIYGVSETFELRNVPQLVRRIGWILKKDKDTQISGLREMDRRLFLVKYLAHNQHLGETD